MKIYLVEWVEDNERGKAIIKADSVTEAINSFNKTKQNVSIKLIGEIESDVHIIVNTGILF